MKIFTKTLLTLMLLCVANGVNAQKIWQKVFAQGWAYEWRTDAERYQGAISPDGEGVYKVYCRSVDQAVAAGNMTTANADADKTDPSNFVDWDSQFFITWGEEYALKEGDKVKVSFQYRADNPITGVASQAHAAPGDYHHYEMLGNFDFTEDWQSYESDELTISSNQAGSTGCWTVAFNLAKGTETTYYFKDVKVEIFGEKTATKTVVSDKFEWKQLVVNGDAEGDDVSAFFTRTYPYVDGEPSPHSVIENGKGVDGSRAIVVTTNDKVENAWDTQFWIKFNQELPAGAKIRTKFNYRADEEATAQTQSHTSKPGENSYIYYSMIGDVKFTTDWQDFQDERSVSTDQSTAEKAMGSIAFNLNPDDHPEANVYYFDNVSIETGQLINDVQHYEEGIRVLFTGWTNLPDLITENANGKRRLEIQPENSPVKVTVDGAEMPIKTVEYDREGQLYIFPEDDFVEKTSLDDSKKVVVTFTNSEDAKYRILYTNGDNAGKPVENFELESTYNDTFDFLPFAWGKPELESSDPEEGSFNLPGSINTFKVTFDKSVQCKYIEAKLDGLKLNVEYAEEEGAEITLKYTGSDVLADGAHAITITKVYSTTDAQRYEAATCTINFSVGAAKMHDDLVYSLDKAKNTLSENEDDRYAGAAFTALKDAIEKYEAEGASYTTPSAVKAACNDLSLNEQNLKEHRANCDSYDENVEKAVNIVAEYSEGKFASTELFQELKSVVEKYENKVLTDDEELKAAVEDLNSCVAKGEQMFTEGVSNNGDAGIKVLVDRIRQGAESLKALGVSEDDELIVAADNAMTDDDALAQAIKNRLTLEAFGKIKDGSAAQYFEETYDEEGNPVIEGIDMTVFVKNPNMYALHPADGINTDNTPGWELLAGNMGLYGAGGASWGNPRNIDGLPEDCAFTIYHADTRAEQTITDLPAGNYIVTLYGSDWGNKKGDDGEGPDALGFVYCKTSDTPAVEEGAEEDRDVNFAATATCEYAGQYQMNRAHDMQVEVKDGKLTIGMQFASDSQYFYGDVKLKLVGALEGYDYAKAYEDILSGVDAAKTAKVRSTELFGLNGQRISAANKGVVIVKKTMSDGSVKVEKAIK